MSGGIKIPKHSRKYCKSHVSKINFRVMNFITDNKKNKIMDFDYAKHFIGQDFLNSGNT